MAIVDPKIYFLLTTFLDPHFIIDIDEIKLGKILNPTILIK